MRYLRSKHALLGILLLLCAVFASGLRTPTFAEKEAVGSALDKPPFKFRSPNERFCFVSGFGTFPAEYGQLNAGCYIFHSPRAKVSPETDLQYIHILNTKLKKYTGLGLDDDDYTLQERVDLLKPLVREIVEHYGADAIYAIGNEMDRPPIILPNGTIIHLQDDELPADYAYLYHELYNHIKTVEPTAQVMIGGVVQPSPLRLEYLDLILDSYRSRYGTDLPTDIWNIHAMILNEVSIGWGAGIPPGIDRLVGQVLQIEQHDDIEIFIEQIELFRQWMSDRGYRDTPLVISEFAILLPTSEWVTPGFEEDDVTAFMQATFDYLMQATDEQTGYPADDNRLVQMWSWFPVVDKHYDGTGGSNGMLFLQATGEMTAFGELFRDYLATDPAIQQLRTFPEKLEATVEPTAVDARITLENVGLSPAEAVVVRVWDGRPEDGGMIIADDRVVDELLFGDDNRVELSVPLGEFTAGVYTVYVEIDPDNELIDKDLSNNFAEVNFVVTENFIYFPVVMR